jgi:hypothetical protein
MPSIVHYIKQPTAFDPESLSVMGTAYERVLMDLPKTTPTKLREVIAARIIGAAGLGERDPDKLCQIALSALGAETMK